MTSTSSTLELAAVLSQPRPGGADDAVLRMRVLDALGAVTSGRTSVDGAAAGRVASRLPGMLGQVLDLVAAARCSEVDDIELRSATTPGCVAVPVALAVCAARHRPDEDLLAAVAAGYEAMVRTGQAAGGAELMQAGLWPSHLVAPIGAAATAARALRLDAERTGHALALAAARCVGASPRAMSEPSGRWLVFATAAVDGVVAALSAEAGAHGPAGDLALTARTLDASVLTRPGPSAAARVDVKPTPGARQLLTAVDAARKAHVALGGGHVASVRVGVPDAALALVDRPRPRGRLASLASVQAQVGAALGIVDGAHAVRVEGDAGLSARWPAVWGGRATVEAPGARTAQAEVLALPVVRGLGQLADKHRALGWRAGLDEAAELCAALDGGGSHANDLLAILTRPTEVP